MFELVMSKGFIMLFSSLMLYIIAVVCIMIVYDEVKISIENKDRKMAVSKTAVFIMSTPLAIIIYMATSAFLAWGESIG